MYTNVQYQSSPFLSQGKKNAGTPVAREGAIFAADWCGSVADAGGAMANAPALQIATA
jgi:hypothetical protein